MKLEDFINAIYLDLQKLYNKEDRAYEKERRLYKT